MPLAHLPSTTCALVPWKAKPLTPTAQLLPASTSPAAATTIAGAAPQHRCLGIVTAPDAAAVVPPSVLLMYGLTAVRLGMPCASLCSSLQSKAFSMQSMYPAPQLSDFKTCSQDYHMCTAAILGDVDVTEQRALLLSLRIPCAPDNAAGNQLASSMQCNKPCELQQVTRPVCGMESKLWTCALRRGCRRPRPRAPRGRGAPLQLPAPAAAAQLGPRAALRAPHPPARRNTQSRSMGSTTREH